ncbi:GNAT family N-acetyltransferase [Erysipelothrix anatis]|uniref:GNAT family N-acetyltransferase n=1 Tax=Erysipelothrix anatis TaxID=2683713 RepID=UPI00135B2F6F|nr:GNAT family N-acetyltransferase [Erysipelothrix anatis]
MFRLATHKDVPQLQKLLIKAWEETYKDLYSEAYIESVILEFYNYDRLMRETSTTTKIWSGYFIIEIDNEIVGCIGGGIVDDLVGEIFVLYIDPDKKRKGYGTNLVQNFTRLQKERYSIKVQRVSVSEGNSKGIPFYEALGFKAHEVRDLYSIDDNVKSKSIVMQRTI